MKIPLYQIDAFTDRVFGGNPAAVCLLEDWLSDEQLQAIAAETNLSDTAFLYHRDGQYALRWFTPQTEADLCGHATLAAAHVVLTELAPGSKRVHFESPSGPLAVEVDGQRLVLDFPTRAAEACVPPPGLVEGLGRQPSEVYRARDYLVVYESQADVLALAPETEVLKQVETVGIIATAPGEQVDFVSRFFAPRMGIPEDPVCGSAHCTLIPYWAKRLARQQLHARQVSRRGGQLWCELKGDRVSIAGHVARFSQGMIDL